MLIFDRTEADKDRARYLLSKNYISLTPTEKAEYDTGLKGCLNYNDLNRIEENTSLLKGILNGYGHAVEVSTRQWVVTDFPTHSEINRIRNNINALHNGFYTLPDFREILYKSELGFEDVNTLEWDLHCIYIWLDRMTQSFSYCGNTYCGE